MANTSVQRDEVERWVRGWLQARYGQPFTPRKLRLSTGGHCEFDAVSADERVVVMISTGTAKTRGGNGAAGKMNKLRSDALFLTMLPGDRQRLVVLTATCMYESLAGEAQRGRLPAAIEVLLADGMPPELKARLLASQLDASREVSRLVGGGAG